MENLIRIILHLISVFIGNPRCLVHIAVYLPVILQSQARLPGLRAAQPGQQAVRAGQGTGLPSDTTAAHLGFSRFKGKRGVDVRVQQGEIGLDL